MYSGFRNAVVNLKYIVKLQKKYPLNMNRFIYSISNCRCLVYFNAFFWLNTVEIVFDAIYLINPMIYDIAI